MYSFSFCDKSYVQNSGLNKHMAKEHPSEQKEGNNACCDCDDEVYVLILTMIYITV